MKRVVLLSVLVVLAIAVWLASRRASESDAPLTRESATTITTAAPAATPTPTLAQAEVQPIAAAPSDVRAPAIAAAAPAARSARLIVVCVARADQRPLAGLVVGVSDGNIQGWTYTDKHAGRIGEGLVTDSEGRVEFELDPGVEIDVHAKAAKGATLQVSTEHTTLAALTPGEVRELRIEHDIGDDGRFHGRVVAAEDEHPIEGARVTLEGRNVATTDRAGRFEASFTTFNLRAFEIEAAGYALASVAPARGCETPATARKITLQRSARLSVALLMPPPGANVHVELTAHRYEIAQEAAWQSPAFDSSDLKWSAAPDALGVCTFESLPPSIRIRARAQASSQTLFTQVEPIVLAPGETRRVEWDLRSGCRLIGRAREVDGRPAANVAFWLLKGESGYRAYAETFHAEQVVARAKSSAEGEFVFENVSAGSWEIAPEARMPTASDVAADAIARFPLAVEIAPAEREKRVEYAVERGRYISGKLLAQTNDEGLNGYIIGRAPAGEYVQTQITDHGSFALGPLLPGDFDLQFNAYGNFLPAKLEHVSAGTKDLIVRLRSGAVISGRIVDASSGSGVQAALCLAALEPGSATDMTMLRSGNDGSFRLEGLVPARYSLSATTTAIMAGVARDLDVTLGTPLENVVIELKPGAKLHVRYEGSGGVGSFLIKSDAVRLMADGVHAGTSTIHVVPPGSISIELSIEGESLPRTQSIALAAGDDKEVVFRQSDAK